MKTLRLLGVAAVGVGALLSGTVGGPAGGTATSAGATADDGAAGASPAVVEAMAVGLARDLRAVSIDGVTDCPVEELEVRWTPAAETAPLGVNGTVVCPGLDEEVLGFEARRVGRGWRLFPLPHGDVVAASPWGFGQEFEPPGIDLAALPDLASPIDDYADYEPQRLCDPTVKPGTRALAGLLLAAVPGTGHLGITRDCSLGPTSEHKEGRAFDWAVAPAQHGEVEQVLARLLATDAAGNPHALARRMGVMYVIWNGRIWASYRADEGWRPFPGRNPHRGHVHVSLSRDGAAGRTTLWQAGVANGWWELPSAWASPAPVTVVGEPPSPATPVALAPPGPGATAVAPDDGGPASVEPTPIRTTPPRPQPAPAPDEPAPTPGPSPSRPMPPPDPVPTAKPSPTIPDEPEGPTPPPPEPSEDPDPAPVDPTPVDPTPVDPTPVDPTPVDPTPVDPTPDDPAPADAPIRILVRFADEATDASRRDVLREDVGADLVHRSGLVPGLETWQVAAEGAEEIVAGLAERPEVVHAELDGDIVAERLDGPWPPVSWSDAGDPEQPAEAADGDDGTDHLVVAVIGADEVPEDADLVAELWSNPTEIAGNGVDDDDNGYVDDVHGWSFCPDDVAEADPEVTPVMVTGELEGGEPEGVGAMHLAPLTVICADGTGRLSDALAALDYAVAAGIPISLNPWVEVGAPSALLVEVVTAAELAGHVVVTPVE